MRCPTLSPFAPPPTFVAGTIDLSGAPGVAGGGSGGSENLSGSNAAPGEGLGGGAGGRNTASAGSVSSGAGGGFGAAGGGTMTIPGGGPYGDPLRNVLFGGSGGSGQNTGDRGAGGGAGGGGSRSAP